MRIRAFGQYLHQAVAALVVFESLLLFGFFIGSAKIRDPGSFTVQLQHHWVDGVLYSIAMSVSLLAFGLYSSRQRARVGGIAVRIVASVGAGLVVISFLFYAIPLL